MKKSLTSSPKVRGGPPWLKRLMGPTERATSRLQILSYHSLTPHSLKLAMTSARMVKISSSTLELTCSFSLLLKL